MGTNLTINSSLAGKLNVLCLVAAIIMVLILPFKKEIWYDETVSIRCSKGISHDTPLLLANLESANSDDLARLNTPENVFRATVLDNGNSFLYNICLHWWSFVFGNSISAYMLLSKMCSIATLVVFYLLCNLLFKNNIFTGLAILLLATDNDFMGMSHEIRAYSMGIFFVTIAGLYFFKLLQQDDSPFYLFLTGIFSVGAILSHFLSVYIVLVLLGAIILNKKSRLFSAKNMLAILLPIAILVAFFYFSYTGLQMMGAQNHQIQLRNSGQDFSVWQALLRTLKFTAINFKLVFPAFGNHTLVTVGSFLLVIAFYITGATAIPASPEKRSFHLLFILGISGSFFLLFLSMKAHHYTALYYRYYSFCVPFCCLFVAYLLFGLFNTARMSPTVRGGVLAITVLPAVLLFLLGLLSAKPQLAYNHVSVANQVMQENISKIQVPDWENALLIQCFLRDGYKLNYTRNPNSPNFTLYKADTTEQIPVIKKDS